MYDVHQCMQESCGQAAAADRICLSVTCACGTRTFRSSHLCTHPQMHSCQPLHQLSRRSILLEALSMAIRWLGRPIGYDLAQARPAKLQVMYSV